MVRAPRSHRGGRRFKSSIAHHFAGSGKPRWRNGRRAAFRAQCPYGCVGSNPSLGTKSSLDPPVTSNSCGRRLTAQIRACSSADRALPCGGRGRGFKSRQARHTLPPNPLFTLARHCPENRPCSCSYVALTRPSVIPAKAGIYALPFQGLQYPITF